MKKFFLIILMAVSVKLMMAADAEVINYSESLSIVKGKLSQEVSIQIQINNRNGEKYTQVTIPYSKEDPIRDLLANITVNGQIIKKLSKNDITTRSSISGFAFYQDEYVKEFTLKHNTYPYVISYSYTTECKSFIDIDYWTPIIDTDIPTRKANLTLKVPNGYSIEYKDQKIDHFSIDTVNSDLVYHWTASYTKQLKTENYAPNHEYFIPWVKIKPVSFLYVMGGDLSSWKSFGNWICNVYEGLDQLPDDEIKTIKSKVEGITDTTEMVKALFHYLQDNFRYVCVSIETGGLKPYPASYVASNKYGDCKGLANYFNAVLNQVGIPSVLCIINAGDEISDIDKSFPSQQFNHMIVAVPQLNDTLWIDCTSKEPFGYLGTFDQGREVLLIQRNASHFAKTPTLTPQEVCCQRTIQFSSIMNSDFTAMVKNTYRADQFDELKYIFTSVPVNDQKHYVFESMLIKNMDATDFKINFIHRDSTFIGLSYTANANKLKAQYGNDILITQVPLSVPQLEEPKKRTLPVQIDFPIYKIDSVAYDIKDLQGELTVPDEILIEGKYGQYSCKITQGDEEVKVVKRFLLYAGRYPLEEYKEFYSFINQVKDANDKKYLVVHYE